MKIFFASIILFLIPFVSRAHEVYVLPEETIHEALRVPMTSSFSTIFANLDQFVFWVLVGAAVVGSIFFVSISSVLERKIDPWLNSIKCYAPFVARVTVGLGLIACSYYGALFGPELPLDAMFGAFATTARIALLIIGLLILVGKWVHIAALIALGFFVFAYAKYGTYMLTYTNYLGEIAVLLLIGAHRVSLESRPKDLEKFFPYLIKIGNVLKPFSFMILRIAFGVSLLYASIYAKFIHNTLALQVAGTPLAGHVTSLAQTFGFSPEFLVLGAGIVEIVLGLFFLLGIEIRFTALFLEFWLVLSLVYFGEAVWPHLILIGIPIAFFLYGYDKYSLEGLFFKKGAREPIF